MAWHEPQAGTLIDLKILCWHSCASFKQTVVETATTALLTCCVSMLCQSVDGALCMIFESHLVWLQKVLSFAVLVRFRLEAGLFPFVGQLSC